MQSTIPCLVYKQGAEEAVQHYVSLIPNSRITSTVRNPGFTHLSFELDGRPYTAFDGGETFAFAEGFSLCVSCDTQEEIDRLWEALTADGGEPGRCGWLKDRWGLSWQIIPAELGTLLGDSDGGNAGAATEAMFKMSKLDLAELRRAYESAATPA
ncbi:MAG TPA: VOC family protein [Candidatus Dormibacteraeota bacterium]